MADPSDILLKPWEVFYGTIGTSTAGLIGLMFVVITLVSDSDRKRRRPDATAIYTTPTVVHFSSILLVSAVVTAPWQSLSSPRIVLGFAAAYGIVYVVRVAIRIWRLGTYDADMEDWIWNAILPLMSYAGVLFAAVALGKSFGGQAMFALAASSVTMLFVGIHNAWDIVTFFGIGDADRQSESHDKDASNQDATRREP